MLHLKKIFQLASISLCVTILLTPGCSWLGGDDELDNISGEQQLYKEAQRNLKSENYDLAIRSFQMLESRYPFGRYAEQAQLELIYAYFGAYQFEAATEAAERFIRLHPRHPSLDYAFYMKGLSAYDLKPGLLSRFFASDNTKRDVSPIKIAFAEFSELLARFPDSTYAPDARQRMIHMRNMLARNEIHVANYYFRRGAYLAALKRGQYVVEKLQQTPSVADGLAIMAQSYLLLGAADLAQNSINILCNNYPEHPNLGKDCEFRNAYTADGLERSWINEVSFGLFDPPKPPQFNYEPKF